MPAELNPAGASDRQTVKTVAMVLVGAAVGAVGALWLFGGADADAVTAEPHLGIGWTIGVVVGIVGVLGLVLATHEAGHLLGGWMSGFRFQLFVVGPLMITRTAGGIRARLHTQWSLYGGLALSLPTDLHNLARREARMVAGGPAASLVLGFLGVGAYVAFGGTDLTPRSAPVGWLLARGAYLFGTGSLGVGLITLVPTTTSGFLTDGARLWRSWRGHPAAPRDAAVFALTALLFVKRPRDWDRALVRQACAPDDETLYDVEGRRLAYLHLLDAGDAAAAQDALQEALDRHALYPPTLLPTLFAEAAFFEGAVRGDGEAARRWLDAAGDAPALDASTLLRAQAAAAWAAEAPDAADALRAARAALDASAFPALAEAAHAWLDALARPTPDTAADTGAPAR